MAKPALPILCLGFLLLYSIVDSEVENKAAKQLLRYERSTNKIHIDVNVLSELSALKSPIKIVAAIGDARVGKSTNLNAVRHIWKGEDDTHFKKVFNTSNHMDPCTRGVWISAIPNTDGGSVVFLDVEGSNLGDDAQTNQFSIFATLLCSGLMLFGEEAVTNHNRDFLFRVTRLTEEIWRDQMRDAAVNQFPGLRVVLRQPLQPPEGVTLTEYTIRSIVRVNDEKSKVLRTYFPDERLSVNTIPYVKELKKSSGDLKALSNNQYRQDVLALVKNLKLVPPKMTINGALMNGQAIKELTTKLVDALNKNSWVIFSDTYTALEKSLCEKGFDSLIKPLQSSDHRSISSKMSDVMGEFTKHCVLKSEKDRAKRWLNNVIDGKQRAEEKQRLFEEQRRQKEREERRQKELKEQRRREEELQRQRMEQERQRKIAAEQRRWDDEARARRAEEERQGARQQLQEAEARRAEERARKEKDTGIITGVSALLAVAVGILAFSDERLKNNITSIPGSEYEAIGLRGVKWIWNDEAHVLGMRGEGEGVIAQEVEKMYPEAVTAGSDGYKRVYYSFLQGLLDDKMKVTGLGDSYQITAREQFS